MTLIFKLHLIVNSLIDWLVLNCSFRRKREIYASIQNVLSKPNITLSVGKARGVDSKLWDHALQKAQPYIKEHTRKFVTFTNDSRIDFFLGNWETF
jgi:hypothetical protein